MEQRTAISLNSFMIPSYMTSGSLRGSKIATISPKIIEIVGAAAPEIIAAMIPVATSSFWPQLEYLNSLKKGMRSTLGLTAGFASLVSS
jgi:hypothetical protein